jgi:aminopeptidase N
MTIGVAGFAVNRAGFVDSIPVDTWVYPEDMQKGFYDYAQAVDILPFFIQNIGPYPYPKLANVESTISFGGMENANTIFYFDHSITGTRSSEELLAHEIAHQWFGDAVSETDWPHIWLSEGFATYMANLYLENKYGKDTLNSRLKNDRNKIIRIEKWNKKPVIDSTESKNLMNLLNVNSYEKGGWVLHMLRRKLGDSIFWKGIRTFYSAYEGGNASTYDLQKIFEKTSHQDLDSFFVQWLYTPGYPKLNIVWSFQEKGNFLNLKIEQLQDKLFEFPLEIGVENNEGMVVLSMEIRDGITEKKFPMDRKPVQIFSDPNVNLLTDAEIQELK